jgi:hypothetical protein
MINSEGGLGGDGAARDGKLPLFLAEGPWMIRKNCDLLKGFSICRDRKCEIFFRRIRFHGSEWPRLRIEVDPPRRGGEPVPFAARHCVCKAVAKRRGIHYEFSTLLASPVGCGGAYHFENGKWTDKFGIKFPDSHTGDFEVFGVEKDGVPFNKGVGLTGFVCIGFLPVLCRFEERFYPGEGIIPVSELGLQKRDRPVASWKLVGDMSSGVAPIVQVEWSLPSGG